MDLVGDWRGIIFALLAWNITVLFYSDYILHDCRLLNVALLFFIQEPLAFAISVMEPMYFPPSVMGTLKPCFVSGIMRNFRCSLSWFVSDQRGQARTAHVLLNFLCSKTLHILFLMICCVFMPLMGNIGRMETRSTEVIRISVAP